MIADSAFHNALGLYNYWIVIFLMMTGFYLVIARNNLIKTIIGLNIFQTSVVLFYVTMGKVSGGKGAPIMLDAGHGDDHGHHPASDHGMIGQPSVGHEVAAGHHPPDGHTATESIQQVSFEDAHSHGEAASHAAEAIYSNPLPSVLMLTAIVVGVATTALALALTVRIREDYGTIEEDEILELDRAQ